MNIHQKESAKIVHRIAPIATALSVMLLAACSVPVQVPIQTKPQQAPAFVDELKQKLPNSAQPGSVAPQLKPLDSNKLELPAAAPAPVPEVVWPARGAGDFETAGAVPPIYWYTVGVDERELMPVVAVPASSPAGVDIHDRHPSLLGAVAANPKAEVGDFDRLPRLTPIVPVTNPKAGEDLSDRHPQLYPGGPRVNLRADEDLIDRHPPSLSGPALGGQAVEDNIIAQNPHRKSALPQASPQAANSINARHPQSYPGGPRVNLRADDLLNGPDQSANSAQAAGSEQMDDMWYRDASRNDR